MRHAPHRNLKMCLFSVLWDGFPGMLYARPHAHFQVMTCRNRFGIIPTGRWLRARYGSQDTPHGTTPTRSALREKSADRTATRTHLMNRPDPVAVRCRFRCAVPAAGPVHGTNSRQRFHACAGIPPAVDGVTCPHRGFFFVKAVNPQVNARQPEFPIISESKCQIVMCLGQECTSGWPGQDCNTGCRSGLILTWGGDGPGVRVRVRPFMPMSGVGEAPVRIRRRRRFCRTAAVRIRQCALQGALIRQIAQSAACHQHPHPLQGGMFLILRPGPVPHF